MDWTDILPRKQQARAPPGWPRAASLPGRLCKLLLRPSPCPAPRPCPSPAPCRRGAPRPAGVLGVLDQLERPVRPGVRRAEAVHQGVCASGQGGRVLAVNWAHLCPQNCAWWPCLCRELGARLVAPLPGPPLARLARREGSMAHPAPFPCLQEFDSHNWTVFTPHYIVWICPTPYRARWVCGCGCQVCADGPEGCCSRCCSWASVTAWRATWRPPHCHRPPPPLRSAECKSQCIRNGRYCSPDPDGNLTAGYEGRDVVQASRASSQRGVHLRRWQLACWHSRQRRTGQGWADGRFLPQSSRGGPPSSQSWSRARPCRSCPARAALVMLGQRPTPAPLGLAPAGKPAPAVRVQACQGGGAAIPLVSVAWASRAGRMEVPPRREASRGSVPARTCG